MKQLLIVGMLAGLAAGCAGERAMYAGTIKLKSATPPGLMLEGQEKRPVECYADTTDSLSDLEAGQWAVVEGTRFHHDRELAIGLRECRVIAVAVGNVGDVPGLELRRRRPTPAVSHEPSAPTKK